MMNPTENGKWIDTTTSDDMPVIGERILFHTDGWDGWEVGEMRCDTDDGNDSYLRYCYFSELPWREVTYWMRIPGIKRSINEDIG